DDLTEIVADELANSRPSVHAGDELQIDLSFGQHCGGSFAIPRHAFVLVSHGPHSNELAGIFERSRQRILDDLKFGVSIFLGKAPDFTPSGNWWIVVEIHLRYEIDVLSTKTTRDHRAGFGVAAKA